MNGNTKTRVKLAMDGPELLRGIPLTTGGARSADGGPVAGSL
jgi:hypothetical protein